MLSYTNSPFSLFYMHQGHNFFIIVQDDNLPNSIRMDHLAYMIAFLVKICDLVSKILCQWPSHGFGRFPYITFPLVIELHNVSNDTLINEHRFLPRWALIFPSSNTWKVFKNRAPNAFWVLAMWSNTNQIVPCLPPNFYL